MSECGECAELPLARRCRACQNAYHADWRSKNQERWKANVRAAGEGYRKSAHGAAKRRAYQQTTRHKYQLRQYGLDPETFALMLQAQAGSCQLCEREFTATRRACVDHDHKTGRVRGLLCRTCNAALGGFQDSPRLLRVAANYLESNGTTEAIK